MQTQTHSLLDLVPTLKLMSWFLFLLSWLTFWHKNTAQKHSPSPWRSHGKESLKQWVTGHSAGSKAAALSYPLAANFIGGLGHITPLPSTLRRNTAFLYSVIRNFSDQPCRQKLLPGAWSLSHLSTRGLACGWLELLIDSGTHTLPPFFTIDLCQIL